MSENRRPEQDSGMVCLGIAENIGVETQMVDADARASFLRMLPRCREASAVRAAELPLRSNPNFPYFAEVATPDQHNCGEFG